MSTSPFDRDALWAKAKTFINRSFEALATGDFPTAATWASLALELLGKAALSHKNPCLIADPNDNGVSLMIAAGLSHDHARAKSIPAKAVFSRCERAFQPFSEREAARIAQARNEELHSGLLPFDAIIDQDLWWQRFWAQAVILIEAQGEDVDSFAGAQRALAVQAHLDSNAQHVKQYTAARITEAQGRWELALASVEGRSALARYLARDAWNIQSEYSSPATCPACHQYGQLFGDEVASSDVDLDPDEPVGWQVLSVYPDAFECPECGLVLVGQPYLSEAGLDELISTEREYEPLWEDYGND